MAEGFITRRGGVGAAERTEVPTINFIEKDDSSITVTFKNNDTEEATIFYGLTTPPDDDSVVLDADTTSGNITFSGLDDDTTFTIFSYALVTDPVSKKIKSEIVAIQETTDEQPLEFGVQWNQPTDTVTRLGDAIGLSAGSDFTTLGDDGVWKLRRCMVNDDRTINYYIDPDDPDDIGEVVNTGSYTTGDPADYTGGDGQVMVEIPKFYWKTIEPSSNVYQWWVSPVEADSSYEVHPAFVTDGVEKDFIYMSAFEAGLDGSELTSVSGVAPHNDETIAQFRTKAQARGTTGWQLQTYFGTHALQLLYLIEYADFDTQTTIGRGVVDESAAINTGDTISLGNASGAASGTDGEVSISYRGVENFWGNIWTWVDGLNINNNVAFVANENFASDEFSGDYTSIGTLANSNGYVSDIQFPHFLATEVNGSDTSHLHDEYFRNSSQRIARFGGNWSVGSSAGGFLWRLNSTSSTNSSLIGARLQIL
jgi:hypothetical protein